MAKMFYSIDEVCQKLGKSEAEVKSMVAAGQLMEYRDRDRLMFKADQIDQLAGDDVGEVHLDLEDTSGGSGLGLTGSGIPLGDSREGTGIGAKAKKSPANDDSRAGANFDDDLSLDAVGSGSGLLDLTRESDDTSLGAELLEEVYSGEDHIDIPANASGLFEAATSESGGDEAVAASGIAAMPMLVESYDGSGSGLGVGLMIGAIASLAVLAIITVVSVVGATPQLAMTIADNLWIWSGGLFGLTAIAGIIGLFIGKASE